MKIHHAQIGFVLSVFLLSLVGLNFLKLSETKNKNPIQQKTDLAAVVEEIGQVLPGSTSSYHYKFYLKEVSTASNITTSGENKSSEYITGATVKITNQSSFHCGESGSDYTFSQVDGYYKLTCQEAAEMKLQISKSGYTTKNISISHYQGEVTVIYLSKAIVKPPPPPPPPPETIKNVNLPEKFKQTGASTDLSKIADPAKVENLTLDTEKGTILFKEVVDLSSTEIKDKFKELDKYVKAEQTGVIGVDSVNLPVLNKKATITMKSLNFVKTPKVLVDGKEDKAVVSNIKYADGVLTFDVTHFSTFIAAPNVEISEPTDKFESKSSKITLKGKVSDLTASVSAKLNDKDLGKLNISTKSGEFSKEIELKEGLNKIVVNALSENGAVAVASVSGSYVKLVNSLTTPLSLLLLLLGTIGIACLVWATKKLMAKKKLSNPVKEDKKSEPPTINI